MVLLYLHIFFFLLFKLVWSQPEGYGRDNNVYLLVKINANKNDIYNNLGIQALRTNHNQTSTQKNKVGQEKSTGYTKVAVALGRSTSIDESGSLDSIEVIDITSSSTKCKNLEKFPYENKDAVGGLGFGDIPIICGGFEHPMSCHSYQNRSWKPDAPLKEGRYYSAMIRSPIPSDHSILLIAGGESQSSTEVLTKEGWKLSTPLPVEIKWHCMVRINSSSAIVIGGATGIRIDDNFNFKSDRTFILNGETKVWSEGPSIKRARRGHSCAMIKKDSQSQDKSVIVVGGDEGMDYEEYEHTLPTEVLDVESLEWRSGPKLSDPIKFGLLVEDPTGGIIYIVRDDYFYRLPHVGSDATWEIMNQELKKKRTSHLAILIPDDLANCN